MTEVTQDGLTIDELARRVGMTVRNVRAYQSRGLLPPPDVRGRTGYYRTDHVTRLELIRELQTEGFNLEAIRRLIETAPGSSEEPLRFTRAVRAPFEDETPQVVEAEELARRFGGGDPKLIARAEKLGVLRSLGDGRFEEASPRLGRAGEELAALGVPAEAALELVEKLRRQADGAARAFVELFLDRVWRPFEEEGWPESRWPEVREALERLRPLASEGFLSIFQLAMSDAVDKAFGRELERMGKGAKRKAG